MYLFLFFPLIAESGNSILAAGAEQNSKQGLINAAAGGRESDVRKYLEAGASIDGLDKEKRTALMFASYNGHVKVTRLLISRGANLNLKSQAGYSALMYAAFRNHKTIFVELLAAGADYRLKNRKGRTALAIARAMNFHHIVDYMKKDFLGKRLRQAVKNDNRPRIQALLKDGAEPNLRDEAGATLLSHIIRRKDLVSLRRLIALGVRLAPAPAPANKKNSGTNSGKTKEVSPLLQAARTKDLRVFRLVLKNLPTTARISPQKKGEALIFWALRQKDPQITRALLGANLKLNISAPTYEQQTPLIYCIRHRVELTGDLIQAGADVNFHKSYATPLRAALQTGDIKVIKLLLDSGALVKYKKGSPLWNVMDNIETARDRSARDQKIKIFATLVKAGADVNALRYRDNNYPSEKKYVSFENENNGPRTGYNQMKFDPGPTLLMLAVQNRRPELVEILLRADAKINERDNYHNTALHYTINNNRKNAAYTPVNRKRKKASHDMSPAELAREKKLSFRVLQLLLKRGALVNIQGHRQRTALWWAAHLGRRDLVEALLQAGANRNLADQYGVTPAQEALRKKYPELARLIQQGPALRMAGP